MPFYRDNNIKRIFKKFSALEKLKFVFLTTIKKIKNCRILEKIDFFI